MQRFADSMSALPRDVEGGLFVCVASGRGERDVGERVRPTMAGSVRFGAEVFGLHTSAGA